MIYQSDLDEYETELGYTNKSISQDIHAFDNKIRAKQINDYNDLMKPLIQAQRKAYEEDNK